MPAPAAPALVVKRVGTRQRQQFAPAFTQGHTVRRIAGKDCIGKIVIIYA
jgi:hypothetical protein